MSTYIPADLRRQVRTDAGRRCNLVTTLRVVMQ